MPALLLHMSLAQQAAAAPGAPAAIARAVAEAPDALLLGSVLPDLPYHARFGAQLLRHLLGAPYRHSAWGDVLHTRGTGALALAMLEHVRRCHARGGERARMLALAAGYISHHAADRVTHPVIQRRVAALLRPGDLPMRVHTLVESRQSFYYHLDLLGHDLAGSPFPARLTRQMAGASLLRPTLDRALAELLRAALLQVHARAPGPAELWGWLHGVTAYGRLLSSPLGRRERFGGDPAAGRAEWYRGPGLDLQAPLQRSLDATVEGWGAAAAALEAARLTPEVRQAFSRRVPDVDLGTGD